MKISPALAAFASDGGAQGAALDAVQAAQTAWLADPAGAAMAEMFAEAHDLPAAQAFARLRRFVDRPDWLNHWLALFLSAMGAQPLAPLPFSGHCDDAAHGLTLAGDRRAQLTLTLLDPDGWAASQAHNSRAVVSFAGALTRTVFLRAGGVRIAHYRLDGAETHATLVDERRYEDGDAVSVPGAHRAFRITGLESACVMLRLSVRDAAVETVLECDAVNGKLVHRAQAQDRAGRDCLLMALLFAMGRSDAVPLLAARSRDNGLFPSERWQAMRYWLALDTASARAGLSAMAVRDPDDAVRALAAQLCNTLAAPQAAA